ncbi:GLYOXYLATE/HYDROXYPYRUVATE REDUCTASE HPR3 [Salix viminalis]|uniref:glyoxylate reductase (NADP(+)) n=1 Tax=Salix viminalis TaxID=40686 RepID=A0A9Q0T7C2_SALVM|nr:GLYOXYLATE/HYDROXYPYRUVATE REDUCTASE HPR3 [Salix viminalis]
MAAENPNFQNTDPPTVLVHRLPTFDFPPGNRLSTHFHLLDPITSPPTSPVLLHSIRALLCVGPVPVTPETLNRLPSLQIIVGSSAGVDHIDLTECRRRNIAVTNAGSAFSEDTADYAVALLFGVLRRLPAGDRYVRDGFWPVNGDFPLGFKLGAKRVGILGLGSIGSEVAKRLAAFGCSIAYFSRKKKTSVLFPYYENAIDLAANSDVLIVCCALNDETHHIVNKDVMVALGKEGVIINVGRGPLVDEKQLVEFLVRGELGGAGLDVFENEPNVPKELLERDNVVLSPHCSVATPESFEALQDVIIANLKAFFSNKPLLSPVQKD